jgi:hypothetical protein
LHLSYLAACCRCRCHQALRRPPSCFAPPAPVCMRSGRCLCCSGLTTSPSSACSCSLFVRAGMTWDELVLVVNEQPWPEGSTAGRSGSQVRHLSFHHKFAH